MKKVSSATWAPRDRVRVVFHKKKIKNGHFNSKNIFNVKKRHGFITKVQGRVTGREHLVLNHPPLDPFGSKVDSLH